MAANLPSKQHCTHEPEDFGDIQQRLNATFARFWTKLLEKMQTPQAKSQTLPYRGERNHESRVKRETPLNNMAAKRQHVSETQHMPPNTRHPEHHLVSQKSHSYKRPKQTSQAPRLRTAHSGTSLTLLRWTVNQAAVQTHQTGSHLCAHTERMVHTDAVSRRGMREETHYPANGSGLCQTAMGIG
ncbi:Hypothetical predicted protein [Pelobates cultripes]|uniref:Uncharacterized protein n=1 Tax=Pelobates cultripes TaxID=61616 RepID=A0AAD1TJB7_PELCU|nr:Hypothetical predicted protein [Pelobates cultripes]